MGGKHAGPRPSRGLARGVGPADRRRALIAGVGVLVLALVILILAWLRSDDDPAPRASEPEGSAAESVGPPCLDLAAGEVTVAVSPDLHPVLAWLVEDSGCPGIELSSTESAEVAEALLTDSAVPPVWVPDSTLWLGRVQLAAGDDSSVEASRLVGLASSPVVVAAAATTDVADLTWRELLAEPGLKVGDPTLTTAALAPLLGARLESRAEGLDPASFPADLAPLATRVAQREPGTPVPSATQRLEAAVSSEGYAAISEQAAVVSSFEVDSEMQLEVPARGTAVLDFPAVVTAGPDQLDQATAVASWLGELTRSPTSIEVLAEAGFRDAEGRAPTGDGLPIRSLRADAEVVAETLRAYDTALAAAARS